MMLSSLNAMEHKMITQALTRRAKEIVTTSLERVNSYADLSETQREQLTAASIQGMQFAHEVIDDVVISEKFTSKLIDALNESNMADRNVLLKEIGEMLLSGAIKNCEREISDSLEQASDSLNINRQFNSEYYEFIANDNAQRVRDINLTLQGV